MTINIRSNVFETNSSSSHSFSLTFPCAGDKILETIKPNENGQIILTGGNYTRSEFEIRTPLDKAGVVAATIIVYGDTALKELFEKVMKEHTGASEIVYDIRLQASDGNPPNTFYCPRLLSAYSYYYDEDKDEEFETAFGAVIKDPSMLKTFIFSKSAYFDVGIYDC